MRKKIMGLILASCLALSFGGCGGGTSSVSDSSGAPGMSDGAGDSASGGAEITETQIIADRTFQHGFNVKSQTDGIATPIGQIRLDENDTAAPLWNIGQWYCGYYHKDDQTLYDSYNIMNAAHSVNGTKHTFIDASKKLSVDTETGEIGMRLLGTEEYTANRQQNEPWPHLLLEYSMTENYSLAELKSVRFEMDFMLTKLTSGYTSPSQIDTDLHTAQFVFYCTLRNNNPQSEDYGSYIWFGLNLFDARYEIVPAYASQDSGKEINTGAFIYQPISSVYCRTPTRLGEEQNIDFDMLPRMRDAFKAAQDARFLVNTKWEDLALCSGNFGFEVTGTYDIAAEITTLNLFAGF